MMCDVNVDGARVLGGTISNIEQGVKKAEVGKLGCIPFNIHHSSLDIRYSSSCPTKRDGVVLVAVLVALLVVMLISATIVRGLVVQHRLARKEQQRVQAFWFAESAVQRARTQLETSPDYDGETWRIESNDAGTAFTSQAVIRVEPIEGELIKRTIVVKARWPDDPIDGVLEERSLIVEVSKQAE